MPIKFSHAYLQSFVQYLTTSALKLSMLGAQIPQIFSEQIWFVHLQKYLTNMINFIITNWGTNLDFDFLIRFVDYSVRGICFTTHFCWWKLLIYSRSVFFPFSFRGWPKSLLTLVTSCPRATGRWLLFMWRLWCCSLSKSADFLH